MRSRSMESACSCPIMIMGLAIRKHVLAVIQSERARRIGAVFAGAAAVIAASSS